MLITTYFDPGSSQLYKNMVLLRGHFQWPLTSHAEDHYFLDEADGQNGRDLCMDFKVPLYLGLNKSLNYPVKENKLVFLTKSELNL